MIETQHSPIDLADQSKPVGLTRWRWLQDARLHPRSSLILAFLVLIHVAWGAWGFETGTRTIDFFTFWTVSHVLSHHPVPNIYSLDGQREMASIAVSDAQSPNSSGRQKQATAMVVEFYRGRIDATAAPLLYSGIGWLSSGNFEADQKRFVFVCISCLLLSLILLTGLLQFSVLQAGLLMIFFMTYSSPVLSDMRVGNVNEIQLLAISLFIFFTARARPFLAGLVIGAATMFKPTTLTVLALAVIAALIEREYRPVFRMLAGSFITAVACFLLSSAYFRTPTVWLDFLRSLGTTLNGVTYPLENGNFSLSALLFGATGRTVVVIPVILLAVFSLLLFATRHSRAVASQTPEVLSNAADRKWRLHTAFVVGGVGCTIMLLSSPLAWLHYYLLILPLSLYVIRPVFEDEEPSRPGGTRNRSVAALGLPFVPLLVFSIITELTLGPRLRTLCVLVILATILTLVLASFHFWQQRKALSASESNP